MENKIKGMSFTKLLLGGLGLIGVVVFGEEWLSGEGYATIQSFIGYAMGGGSLTALMVIQLLTKVIPTQTAKNVINNVGEAKVSKVFDTVDELKQGYEELKGFTLQLIDEIKLDREIKQELGIYDNLPQELKDRL
jgi:hypothetical protein